jgi:putative membrane protein
MNNPTRTALITIDIFVLALLVLSLVMGGPMIGGMMGRAVMGWGVAVMPWRGLLTVVVWALIIAGIGLLFALSFRQIDHGKEARRPQPLDILKERYARGEIGREQYEQMRHDLD